MGQRNPELICAALILLTQPKWCSHDTLLDASHRVCRLKGVAFMVVGTLPRPRVSANHGSPMSRNAPHTSRTLSRRTCPLGLVVCCSKSPAISCWERCFVLDAHSADMLHDRGLPWPQSLADRLLRPSTITWSVMNVPSAWCSPATLEDRPRSIRRSEHRTAVLQHKQLTCSTEAQSELGMRLERHVWHP